MSLEFNGKSIETTATGYLVNHEDWSEDRKGSS
jgi:sulfur relay (sulfurtransferase) DsrC/TusE family protein